MPVADVETWARDTSLPASQPRSRPTGEDPAVIIYTSGTTGASKGAILSHGNLAAIVTALLIAWRWQADDVLLVTLPLFHVHGLIGATTASLAAGGRILLRERFDAREVLDTIAAGTVTMFFGVPTMYVRLLENAAERVLPAIRLYVSGSAALSPETHRAFAERFGAKILERYGATEFGFALGNRYGGPRVAGSVGIPMPGVRVRIAAPDGLDPLPEGAIGELLVAGANVFTGYWERPQEYRGIVCRRQRRNAVVSKRRPRAIRCRRRRLSHRRTHQGTHHHRRFQRLSARSRRRARAAGRRARVRGRRQTRFGPRRTAYRVRRNRRVRRHGSAADFAAFAACELQDSQGDTRPRRASAQRHGKAR